MGKLAARLVGPSALASVTTLTAVAMLWILAIVLASPMSLQPPVEIWLQLAALCIRSATVPGVLRMTLFRRGRRRAVRRSAPLATSGSPVAGADRNRAYRGAGVPL